MHPVLFKIFGFEVHSFGVAMVVAFVLSVALAQSRGPRYGISKQQVGDMAFWAILAGVFGARFLFIVQEWSWFMANPRELLSLQFRGLTSFGGLLFGMGAAVLWARKKGIPVRNLLDVTAPAFLVGHLVGRVGCLLNGCCFGGVCPANVPWAIHVDHTSVLHHPAQIYDSLMNLGALGIVLLIERRASLQAGQVTGLVVALHGLSRFIYEFWRAGSEEQVRLGQASSTYWGNSPFTQAQGMAAALILFGALLFAFARRRKSLKAPSDDLSTAQPTS